MSGFNMDDYVSVAERIDLFYAKHPDGSLQSELVELTPDRVTVKAHAYRTADDPRPGIGHSSVTIPGSTPYTRGSEIENAETSAWGRAIASLGFEVKRGISSGEEVRNKQPDPWARGASERHTQAERAPSGPARTPEEQELLDQLLALPGMTIARMSLLADAAHVTKGERANADQLRDMLRIAQEPLSDYAGPPSRGGDPAATPAPSVAGQEGAGGSDPAPSDSTDGASLSPREAPSGPSVDDVLAATGGELVPPKPGTDEYRAMTPQERASARAYWQKATDSQETLAEALGGVPND